MRDGDDRIRLALLDAANGVDPRPDPEDVDRRRRRLLRRGRLGAGLVGVGVAIVAIGATLVAIGPLDRTPIRQPTIAPRPGGPVPEGKLLLEDSGFGEVLVHGSDRHPNLGRGIASDLSPDGNSALVAGEVRQPTGVSQITRLWVEDIWTHQERLLAEAGPEEDLGPISRWSHDGTRVAFRLTVWAVDPSKEHPGPTPLIESVCIVIPVVDAIARQCFSDLGRVYSLDWSPDGGKLVVGGPGREAVQIVDTTTGDVSVVLPPGGSSSVRDALAAAGHGRPVQFVDPIWAPSGRYLAAMASVVGGDSVYVPVVFTAAGEFVAMGQSSTESITQAWSSVADVLAYTRAKAPYTTTGIFLLDTATRRSRLLLDTERRRSEVTSLAWSPSGRWLAANELLSATILILDVDRGSNPAELEQGGEVVAWAR
jgi:hypothetical protein